MSQRASLPQPLRLPFNMPLRCLQDLDCLSIEHDVQLNSLLVSLHGQLKPVGAPATSPWAMALAPAWGIVHDCLAPKRPTQCLLQCVTDYLLPSLHTAGVVHWGWVCDPNPLGQSLFKQVSSRLPQVCFSLFHDLEHATSWLRQQQPLLVGQPAARWEQVSQAIAAASTHYCTTC